MKRMLSVLSFMTALSGARAQEAREWQNLLNGYYGIKNELVAGDAAKTAARAVDFVDALLKAGTAVPNNQELRSFQRLQSGISSAAKSIIGAKDISKQREFFSALSNSMLELSKSVKLTSKTIYVDYCPMKQAYWLSEFQPIKNPYYGNSMLSCGSIKNSIQ